jgi:tetratricopeptide (TPR) repeat protein
MYLRLGKLRKSLKTNREALRLAGWLNCSSDRARAHGNIGLLYEKKRKLGDALKSMDKALELYERIGNPIGAATQLMAIGGLYGSQGKRAEALKRLGEARAKFVQSGILSSPIESAIERALRQNPYDKSPRKGPREFIQSLFIRRPKKQPAPKAL